MKNLFYDRDGQNQQNTIIGDHMNNDLKKIFNKANDKFLRSTKKMIYDDVSERCLCSELKLFLQEQLNNTIYKNYHIDNEYNRNCGHIKTTINGNMKEIVIQCDLIIHSRGENELQDNLIALEMKKSYQSEESKDNDRDRLCALTKSTHDKDTYSYDGKTFPKHVCGYRLGIYYEIDKDEKKILVEYYANGRMFEKYEKKIENAGKKRMNY